MHMLYDTEGALPSGPGAAEQPTSQASPGGGAQPSPVGGADLAAALKEIDSLKKQVASMQSGKDKGIAKVSKKVSDLEELLAKYDGYLNEYGSQKKAKRELLIDELLLEREGGTRDDALPTAEGNRPKATGLDPAALLSSMELDPNDPEVIAALRTASNDTEVVAKFVDIKTRKAKPAPPVSPAQQIPVSGGSAITVTTDGLMKEYRELIKEATPGEYGEKARFDAILAIRKKAAEAQVPSPV